MNFLRGHFSTEVHQGQHLNILGYLSVLRETVETVPRNGLLGLLTSVGMQRFPALIPSVVKESDRTIVIEHPAPEARLHYVVIPKRDIKNIAELSDADRDSLIDVFNVVRDIVKEKNLVDYRVVTNGPGYQGVTYLHFHLIAK